MHDVYLTPTVSLIELIFTLCVALPGWLAAFRSLWLAWGDLLAVKREWPVASQIVTRDDEQNLLTARMGIWIHLAALAARSFFLLLGIQALNAPPPADPERRPTVAAYFAVYIILAVVANIGTVVVDRLRTRITEREVM